MTTKDAAHWRDKYLDLLDEQEAEQHQYKQHVALLEKALLRVSLAAEGYDDRLDEHLSALRDKLREEGSANLEPLFKPLEEQLLITDAQRAESLEKSRVALQNMLISLREVSPPGELRDTLKYKTKEINLVSEQAGGFAELLEQLAELQHLVLGNLGAEAEFSEADATDADQNHVDQNQADQSRTSQTQPDPNEAGATAAQGAAAAGAEQPVHQDSSIPDNPILEGQLQTRDEVEVTGHRRPTREVQGEHSHIDQTELSGMAQQIFPILNDLLNQVDPPADCVAQKAIAVRKRLEKGLQWRELVPTLEDIRDLIMQAYLAADEEHRRYLVSVDKTLQQILSSLGLALGDYEEQQQAHHAFADSVTGNLESLTSVAASASDLESLMRHVDQHLDALQQAVSQRDRALSQVSTPLSEQLSDLVRQIQSIEAEANQAKADLEEQRQRAVTDSLTQLPNREAYVERAHYECNRWLRYQRPLTLAVTDIDHFKRINDTYGHQAGDKVLQVLGKAIAKRLREVDFIARYGGEEFVILLPETDQQHAYEVLDKIREAVGAIPFRFRDEPVSITLSIGLSEFREGDTVESAFQRADQQLYVAKERGRNLCLIAD